MNQNKKVHHIYRVKLHRSIEELSLLLSEMNQIKKAHQSKIAFK